MAMAGRTPGVTLESLLRRTVEAGASDLHLTAGAPPTVRIDGRLQPLDGARLDPDDTWALFGEIAGPGEREALAQAGQVHFSYSLPGLSRFRVSAYRQRGTVALALRVLPSQVPGLDELGLPPALAELALRPQGLLLVAGPAGSGRSTTLAALVRHVSERRSVHVVTLEDPIEYLHAHGRSLVEQREVGRDVPGFAAGLRAALRQDADVIALGELPDAETVDLALAAAETGHLVLAVQRAYTVPQAVERVIEAFPAAQQPQARVRLASCLQGAVVQQLVPRADRPGRVAAAEVLVATPAARDLIREGRIPQLRSVIQTGARYGMVTLERSLEDLYERGVIAEQDCRERLAELALLAGAAAGQGAAGW